MQSPTPLAGTPPTGNPFQHETGSPARLLAKKLLHYPSQHFGKPYRQRRKAQSVDGTFAISAQVRGAQEGNGQGLADHPSAKAETSFRQTQLRTLLEELEMRIKALTNERDELQAHACSFLKDTKIADQLELMADLQLSKDILAADLLEQKKYNADQLSAIDKIIASTISSKDLAEERLLAREAQLTTLQGSNALLQLHYDALVKKHISDEEAFKRTISALKEKVLLLRNQTATNRRASRMVIILEASQHELTLLVYVLYPATGNR